ncbi:MAG: hypothetical protein EXQ92_06090 [Alphaproteobacteria bacterium]|nr:hypothetical protein [Alphaproteobacteria bacterium]
MARRKTVLVLHFAGLMPLAGIAWQAMHYVLGLRRLGYDVWYVEDNGVNPYSPKENQLVWDSTENIAFVTAMMARHGLSDRWAYWDPVKEGSWRGVSRDRLMALYGEADALVNLCGATKLREEHMKCPVRIYIDTDPVYAQVKLDQQDAYYLDYVDSHTHLFTYGENLGAADCPVPLGARTWNKTRPPVVLDQWQPDYGRTPDCFTSVATWQNKGKNLRFQGETYQWSKHVNFLRFLDLPRRTQQCFRLAMITPDAKVNAEVAAHGWRFEDPIAVSASMDSYADFIRDSRGEFTVAKDIYVRPRSGWFSDRSVSYLAAGRPVITQRTGAEKYVPAGRGLFNYDDWDEILSAVDAINADYGAHCRWAREIAAEYFDSDKLLKDMMDRAGV